MFDDVAFDFNELLRAKVIAGDENMEIGAKKKLGSNSAKKQSDSSKMSVEEYEKKSAEAFPATVFAFSGAADNQTAADVGDASSFGLKPVTGPEKAGGATTNSFHSAMKHWKAQQGGMQEHKLTYSRLLIDMQKILKDKKYTQIPSLSTTRQIDLTRKEFTLDNPQSKGRGRRRALLIGINYYGSPAELGGCINDVKMQYEWLKEQGWPVDDPTKTRILTDIMDSPNAATLSSTLRTDGSPTAKNIIEAMTWLTTDTRPGDSLFYHYSGHGNTVDEIPDENGEYHEDDHKDETMVPLDYQTAGQIRDNTIFQLLVAPLEKGVHLLAFFDCCHSGTICDLNYNFTVDSVNLTALQNVQDKVDQYEAAVAHASQDGTAPPPPNAAPALLMQANPEFNFDFAKKLFDQVRKGGFEAMPEVFKTLFVGPEARARSKKLHMCCFGICFNGEAGRHERRKAAKIEEQKKKQDAKNGSSPTTATPAPVQS